MDNFVNFYYYGVFVIVADVQSLFTFIVFCFKLVLSFLNIKIIFRLKRGIKTHSIDWLPLYVASVWFVLLLSLFPMKKTFSLIIFSG